MALSLKENIWKCLNKLRSKMTKVMLISPKDNNFYNFRSELIFKLKEMGYDIILVCPYGNKIDYFTSQGCGFIDIAIDRRGTNVFNDLKLIIAYWKAIKKENPQLVLTYTTKPSVYAGIVCGLLRVPYIVNNAGLMEASGLLSKIMNILYAIGFRKATCLMCQNDSEEKYLESILHNKVPYRLIPGSGVNINQFTFSTYPELTSTDDIYFNYVALIKKIKGIDEYLECAKRIKTRYPHTHFRIYGEYDSSEYNDKICLYQTKGYVEYQGVKIDMKPEIETCHAVIHPSYYEGMTNVVLEHSAMGRICIGSDIPGVKEAIEDGKTGFLFKVRDIDSMVEAVERFIFLSNDEKIHMARAARKKMELEFDRRIVTKAYIDEIERVVSNE